MSDDLLEEDDVIEVPVVGRAAGGALAELEHDHGVRVALVGHGDAQERPMRRCR